MLAARTDLPGDPGKEVRREGPAGARRASLDETFSDVARALNDRIEDVARHVLGEPNRVLSSTAQLRYGRKGSIAIELSGDKRGRWYDHETGEGGDALTLIGRELQLPNGAACDWARDWLGLENGATLRKRDLSDHYAARKPAPHGLDRAAKVAAIVRQCADPTSTPADIYLRRRGIISRPLPPAIRFRADAHGRYGALVVLATDAQDAVMAVQQIYLTDKGDKAPLAVQKRTNKARDDWTQHSAVRLPGTPPIVLCEGVETALSIWQATGHETWACLGISNIAFAAVPEGSELIVARDGDVPASNADRQIRKAVAGLRRRDLKVTVAEPPLNKDFNDVLIEDGDDAVRALIRAATNADRKGAEWRDGLLQNSEGNPSAVLANAIHALRHAPEWMGVLWHNEFATSTVARQPPPWAPEDSDWRDRSWSDRDDYLVAEWLQRQGIMVPASVAGQAVETVARDRTFHPVREYLDELQWDGQPRLDTWLITYLGAADTSYVRAIGPRWLISAVARVVNPGVKADCALILEGPQGIKKSTALSVMGRPWFTDRLSDLGSKDAAMETKGVWIIEIAELDTMTRAEVSEIKAFMSRTQDRFRPPYGKRLVDLQRQCVFAGSINPEGGYLKDATGGRRFWPVVCGHIDIAALERDRDQLWAEARDRFREGKPWWLETAELNALASEEQADRYQGDAWDEVIRDYLENEMNRMENGFGERKAYRSRRSQPLTDVSIGEILENALAMEKGRWTQVDQNRVARCLTTMGFKRCKARKPDGQREWRYRLAASPNA